jgi:DtxR family Mn-dependent transcriptional regulator
VADTPAADVRLPACTPVEQDYLKAVYTASEWSDEPVTTTSLAHRLGAAASTVSETVARLARRGLLVHERYRPVRLSPLGEAEALRTVRRHRLLETYLVTELGFTWDEVHVEAEVLEHVVSDVLLERMDAKLGHPRRDPHGDPIPSVSGEVELPRARLLATFAVGERGVVARVSDVDPDLLRWCSEVGLGLDAEVAVVDRKPYAGTTTVTTTAGGPGTGPRTVEVGDLAAAAVHVLPAPGSATGVAPGPAEETAP